jgi:hypothetical protein
MKDHKSCRNTVRNAVIGLVLLAAHPLLRAQSWTNRFNAPGDAQDTPVAIAVAPNGNVVVTGSSDYTNRQDWNTILYSSAGQPLWTNRYSDSGGKFPSLVLFDPSGNVIVVGESGAGDVSGFRHFVTIKYAKTGAPLWTNWYRGPLGITYGDSPTALGSDTNGNILVAGQTFMDSSETRGPRYPVVAYSSSGTPLWTNSAPALGRDIGMDREGNVTLGAWQYPSRTYYVVTYSTTGGALRTNEYALPWEASQMNRFFLVDAGVVDRDGNVILTGNYPLADSGYPLPVVWMTLKYSKQGQLLWSNSYSGPLSSDRGLGVTADAAGNVVAIGWSWLVANSPGIPRKVESLAISYSSDGVPLWTNRVGTSSVCVRWGDGGTAFVLAYERDDLGNEQSVTIAYSSAGLPLWTNVFQGPKQVPQRQGAALDPQGNAFVTGVTEDVDGSVDFLTLKTAAPSSGLELKVDRLPGFIVLNWQSANAVLQAAPSVSGTFTNVPGATSPFTNALTGGQQFFRLAK